MRDGLLDGLTEKLVEPSLRRDELGRLPASEGREILPTAHDEALKSILFDVGERASSLRSGFLRITEHGAKRGLLVGLDSLRHVGARTERLVKHVPEPPAGFQHRVAGDYPLRCVEHSVDRRPAELLRGDEFRARGLEEGVEAAPGRFGCVLEEAHSERDGVRRGHELLISGAKSRHLKRQFGLANGTPVLAEGLPDDRIRDELLRSHDEGAADRCLDEKRVHRVAEIRPRRPESLFAESRELRPVFPEIEESTRRVVGDGPLGSDPPLLHGGIRGVLQDLTLERDGRTALGRGLGDLAGRLHAEVARDRSGDLRRDSVQDVVIQTTAGLRAERLPPVHHGICRRRSDLGADEVSGEMFGVPVRSHLRHAGQPDAGHPVRRLLRTGSQPGADAGVDSARREELEHETRGGTDDVADHGAHSARGTIFALRGVESRLDGFLVRDLLSVLDPLQDVGHGHGIRDRTAHGSDERHERKIGNGEVGQGLEESALVTDAVVVRDLDEPTPGLGLHELVESHLPPEHVQRQHVLVRVRFSNTATVVHHLRAERVGIECPRIRRVSYGHERLLIRIGEVHAELVLLNGLDVGLCLRPHIGAVQ